MDGPSDCHVRTKKNGVACVVGEGLRGLAWRMARNVATRATSRMSKYLSTYEKVVALLPALKPSKAIP